jgi:hypothetical protein
MIRYEPSADGSGNHITIRVTVIDDVPFAIAPASPDGDRWDLVVAMAGGTVLMSIKGQPHRGAPLKPEPPPECDPICYVWVPATGGPVEPHYIHTWKPRPEAQQLWPSQDQ